MTFAAFIDKLEGGLSISYPKMGIFELEDLECGRTRRAVFAGKRWLASKNELVFDWFYQLFS